MPYRQYFSHTEVIKKYVDFYNNLFSTRHVTLNQDLVHTTRQQILTENCYILRDILEKNLQFVSTKLCHRALLIKFTPYNVKRG